jgi:sugar O-acyltransferase (sialic acid O-acetyltransferase NeuD family)
MENVVIYGAGGLGREVLEILKAQNSKKKRKILGFIDDKKTKGQLINGFPVLGDTDWFCINHQNSGCLVAIGDPEIRCRVVKKLTNNNINFTNAVHPSAVLSDSVSLGENVIICAGVVLTANVTIGSHVVLNANSTIGHDVIIEDYCSIMPSATINGNSHIMTGANFGSGATGIQNITVGEWSIIGAGAVVIKDIPDRVTAVGIPAKIIKTHPAYIPEF